MADIFVSYTSSDRDWAFWIGHELDALGYTPHIHEWELPAGGDIMKWMDERHQAADHILCVVSGAYLERPYSSMERRAAQWAAADDRPNFAIPVFVEPCKAPTLFATLKRCDLYGLAEEDARARLKAFLAPAAKPARGVFPGGVTASSTPSTPPSSNPASSFPGKPSPPSNVLLVKGPPQAPEPCKIVGLAAVELKSTQIGRNTACIDDVQTIVDLRSKIDGLRRWAQQAGFTKLSTVRGIARTCDMSYSTLNSSLTTERVSTANQKAIAKAFGFQVEWPEWRRDTKAFLDKFQTYKLAGERLTIEAQLTKTHLDRRTADFALRIAGSFDHYSENNGIRLVVSLSFDQRGWPVFPDLTVALREVDLQLFCTRDGAEFEILALTCNSEAEGNFHGDVKGTGKGNAYWTIRVADPACNFIAGTRRRNDGQDCICKGFHDGDEIRALMTARKIQCFGTVAGKSLETCSPIKKRFIEHLTKLAVLNGAEATLAEQLLTVVQT